MNQPHVASQSQPAKVLVVDDSKTVCSMLTSLIHRDPSLRVIGTASDGQQAIDSVARLHPHVVTMDFSMPGMNGFDAIKHIMAYHPTPILIVSSTIFGKGEKNRVFEALKYGALDVIDKSPFRQGNNGPTLCERLKTLARVRVITHPMGKLEPRFDRLRPLQMPSVPRSGRRIIAIASSTGGPQALLQLVRSLPANLPCGVVIVQHISDGFDRGLAEWLNSQTELTVKLAIDGESIHPGHVYIAPTNVQMRVAAGDRIRFTDEPPCDGQKPSGSILFDSVAAVYGHRAVCAILTGMGRDGAEGLRRVKAEGGFVIAQDEASCVVFGMPKAAIELGVVDAVRPLAAIPAAILEALGHVVAGKETVK